MAITGMTLVRQTLFAVAVATAATSALAATPNGQPGVADQHKPQVPGYYRMSLGDFEVTALYDGFINLDSGLLKGMSDEDIQTLLARMFISSTDGIQTAVNGYLVNTGSQLILVDTGAAACFGPTLGHIEHNLDAAGYAPEDVDTVLLTHLHPDHSCGLADADGNAAFPNAEVLVPQAEAGFWLNKEVAAKAPKDSQPFFTMSQASVAPYQADNRFRTFQIGENIGPGVEVVSTPGHTPGHVSYLFSSGDESLLVWGDIVHNYAVQFPHPEVSIEFDVDSAQAIVTRKKILADAALDKLWVGGAHLPFPGLGLVRAENPGYAWVPVEYGPILPKE